MSLIFLPDAHSRAQTIMQLLGKRMVRQIPNNMVGCTMFYFLGAWCTWWAEVRAPLEMSSLASSR